MSKFGITYCLHFQFNSVFICLAHQINAINLVYENPKQQGNNTKCIKLRQKSRTKLRFKHVEVEKQINKETS